MNGRRPDDPSEAFGASPPGLLLRIFLSSINPSERGKRRLVVAGCVLIACECVYVVLLVSGWVPSPEIKPDYRPVAGSGVAGAVATGTAAFGALLITFSGWRRPKRIAWAVVVVLYVVMLAYSHTQAPS